MTIPVLTADDFALLSGIDPDALEAEAREEIELQDCDIITFAEKWLGISYEERPAQRVVLKVIYGLELTPDEERIYHQITGGDSPKSIKSLRVPNRTEEVVEAVLCLGARSGKSTAIISVVVLYESIARGHIWKKYLNPGEVGYAIVIATSKEQAKDIIQASVTRMLEHSPRLKGWITESNSAVLKLKNGLRIVSKPCNSKASRGVPTYCLVCDELAHFNTDGKVSDKAVYNSASPRLAQFSNAKTLLITTPAAKQGMFWDWFSEGFNVEGRATFQAPTVVMNPLVDMAYLERERKKDPENYEREYLAQFAEQVAAFFKGDSLEKAFLLAGDYAPMPGVRYVLGIDQSGLTGRDRFSAAVGHLDADGVISMDALRSLDTEHSQEVLDELKALKDAYGLTVAVVDAYGAGWVKSALESLGFEVVKRPALPVVYQNGKSLVLAGRLRLQDDKELRDGLNNTRAFYGRNNSISIQHDRGVDGHADLADAVMTCAWAATEPLDEEECVEVYDALDEFGVEGGYD